MGYYRILRAVRTLITTPWNKVRLRINGASYGPHFRSCGSIGLAVLDGKLTIGRDVYVNSHPMADPIGGQSKTIIQLSGGTIRIGNRVGISNTAICSSNSVTIEDDVCIGAGCKIYDTDFHSSIAEYRQNGNINIKTAPVRIKQRAFIGGHSIVLKGVTIGKESVIGAGSVVTCDIPDGEIWAGNPARFLKKVDGAAVIDRQERVMEAVED